MIQRTPHDLWETASTGGARWDTQLKWLGRPCRRRRGAVRVGEYATVTAEGESRRGLAGLSAWPGHDVIASRRCRRGLRMSADGRPQYGSSCDTGSSMRLVRAARGGASQRPQVFPRARAGRPAPDECARRSSKGIRVSNRAKPCEFRQHPMTRETAVSAREPRSARLKARLPLRLVAPLDT